MLQQVADESVVVKKLRPERAPAMVWKGKTERLLAKCRGPWSGQKRTTDAKGRSSQRKSFEGWKGAWGEAETCWKVSSVFEIGWVWRHSTSRRYGQLWVPGRRTAHCPRGL